VEFKKEAFTLFEDMMARIDNETIRYLFHIQVQQGEQPPSGGAPQSSTPAQQTRPRADAVAASAAAARANEPQHLPAVCSIRRGLRRRKRRSPFARARRLGVMILVLAGQARSTKNATGLE
jgi:preprotein translocase subunit SecA